MALPTPVLSDGDIVEVHSSSYESARLIWNTWSQDPIKAAVLQAIFSYRIYSLYDPSSVGDFLRIFAVALGQNRVCPLHYSSLEVDYLNDFRIPRKLRITSLCLRHFMRLSELVRSLSA